MEEQTRKGRRKDRRQRHMNKCGSKGSITEMGKGIGNQVKQRQTKIRQKKYIPSTLKYPAKSNIDVFELT